MGMLIAHEPDFMIHGVLKYQMFGQDFWITTTTVGMWIVTLLILLIAVLANRTLSKAGDVPGTFQLMRCCRRWRMELWQGMRSDL